MCVYKCVLWLRISSWKTGYTRARTFIPSSQTDLCVQGPSGSSFRPNHTDTSSNQLTSLHSLQTSLDTLRRHRPAYTPRTGFVWPIKETVTTSDSSKKRGLDSETSAEDVQATPSLSDPSNRRNGGGAVSGQGSPKRKENNILLLNAMSTTAQHAKKSFTLPTAVSETTVPGTPVSATVGRSSATPAPSQRDSTPKLTTSQESAPTRVSVAGKRRKKSKASYLIGQIQSNCISIFVGASVVAT